MARGLFLSGLANKSGCIIGGGVQTPLGLNKPALGNGLIYSALRELPGMARDIVVNLDSKNQKDGEAGSFKEKCMLRL